MNSLIHADIFFFISTIALVIITILLSVALIYAIKVFRTLHEASEVVKEKVEHYSHKLDDVEDFIEESTVIQWVQSLMGGKKRARRTSHPRGEKK